MSTRLHDLVVVSGFSGAGKSSAMNVFEDAGYFVVDNLPAEMLRALAGLFTHDGSKVERACVVSDLRAGEEYFERLAAVLDELDAEGLRNRVLFLAGRRADAADPLQGDPAAPPARARTGTWPAASGARPSCSRRSASAPTA